MNEQNRQFCSFVCKQISIDKKEMRIVNRYYRYENIELWEESVWEDKISPIFGLVKWLGSHEKVNDAPYKDPVNGLVGDACKVLKYYDHKTNSVNRPEVIEGWRKRGVYYDCRAQGGLNWLIMAPRHCLQDFGRKLPALVVMHREDITDPYWSMKTLDHYQAYNEMLANAQDMIIIYIVTGAPDFNRVYVNILQEAFVFVPGDTQSVFLDVSTVYDNGCTLKEIPDLIYKGSNGHALPDPDAAVIRFGSAAVPSLEITGLWENKCSLTRDQVSKANWSSASFDLDRVIHSETGKKMVEGMILEYQFDSVYDPQFVKYWEDRGLKYESRETKLRRWKAAVPLGALEKPEKKLPLLCVMQEVNHANEHLAVTGASYFYEYFRIAAQGACILVNFVLEDADGNELLCEILKEAFELYPIDRSRVYLAGHSHNGYYALEFAERHPKLIAAVATFGDTPGLMDTGMVILFTEEKVERLRNLDIPLINLAGYTEPRRHFPISQDGDDYRPWQGVGPLITFEQRAAGWQRRLRAFNCPMKSFEEIKATKDSPEQAVRMLGIPGDRSETLWLDGFELYIVDIKNNEGKFHLRMVGEENMPHNTTPVQQRLSWSFMRRFARDTETGKTIELF